MPLRQNPAAAPSAASNVKNTATLLSGIVLYLLLTACGNGGSGSNDARLPGIGSFQYAGAFAIPGDTFGSSSANWSNGTIEISGQSMFIAGNEQEDAIAEFIIPELVNSVSIEELNFAQPKQNFVSVLNRTENGNSDELDQYTGFQLFGRSLVVNAIEFYDAATDNTLSTFVINDAANLASSPVSAITSLKGYARASGWISPVPQSLQTEIPCSHITGNSSGAAIISRHSVGPSAFCINLQDLTTSNSSQINTTELIGFSLDKPLHDDLLNESGRNSLWNHISTARFGFVVPGTRTYATFGHSGGNNSVIGYKITQLDGTECQGHCAQDPNDYYNYYWLWNIDDMKKVLNGDLAPNEVRPYAYGKFNTPFQTSEYINEIGGGSYDPSTGTLYLSLLQSNNQLGPYQNPPIIVAYKVR